MLNHLPESVVFLHTQMKASLESAGRCAKFLADRGVQTSTHETSAFDPRQVAEDVVGLAVQQGLGRVLLNYTGGTKVMSLAAYNSIPAHIPKIYFDSREGLMVDQGRFNPVDQPLLTVPDVFALHADVSINSTVAVPPAAGCTTELLGQRLCQNPKLASWLGQYRSQTLNGFRKVGGWALPSTPMAVPFQNRNARLAGLLEKAMRSDDLLQDSSGAFLPNEAGLAYLDGFWWEGVVVRGLRQGFESLEVPLDSLDIRTNLNIIWTSSSIPTPNELDVALVYRNRLYLISCTTASEKETEKRRVQVEALTDRLGGHFAKAMLATTQPESVLGKLRARSSDRLVIPALEEWSNPKELLEKWFRGDSFREKSPASLNG
jgi:hypothetical protein